MQSRLPILLASSSPYRRQQLASTGLSFTHAAPNIDETPKSGETPLQLACRLAANKAQKLASQFPNHLIIGSDQTACCEDSFLSKPGNYLSAKQQLLSQSGKTIEFYSAVAVFNSKTLHCAVEHELTRVTFRELSEEEIDNYLAAEQPYDCAGSFKSEGLGITLFDKICSADPSALIGLPLLKTLQLLRKEGITPLF